MAETLEVIREFVGWPKIARWNRNLIVTEKIDGTNAAIIVTENGDIYAQSRSRVITPQEDNFGFATWVDLHGDELKESLGIGRHFGEWWGSGIQRGYGLPKGERRFSLFNTSRWTGNATEDFRCNEAPLCYVVPVLAVTTPNEFHAQAACDFLALEGSKCSPGFMKPEGVVIFHTKSNVMFKATVEKDDEYKGQNA